MNSIKLYKERFRLEIGRNRFANRICDEWNHLRIDVISASSLNMFKDRLDHQLRQIRGLDKPSSVPYGHS